MTLLGILVFVAGVGIMWLWQYAYSPQGRARFIIVQLKNDTTSFRGWMLEHHVVRPGFSVSPSEEYSHSYRAKYGTASDSEIAALYETLNLGRKALPVEIEALHDEHWPVRRMAIRACGQFHDPAAIQPLAECMRDAPRDPTSQTADYVDVAFRYLDALIEIGPEAFGPIMEAAKQRGSLLPKGMPGMMAESWGPRAVQPLIELLDGPEEWYHESAAAELGWLRDGRAADALIRHLDDVEDVRIVSARALGRIGDRKAIPALLKTFNSPPLEDRENKNVARIAAAGTLARMGRDEGLQYLLSMAKSANPLDRADAACSMGAPPIKGTFGLLLSLMADSDGTVRLRAVRTAGELGDPRAIPAIGKLLNDPVTDVRRMAVRALETIQDPSAIAPLKAALNDSDWSVRDAAARALETLGVRPSPASHPGKP